MIFDALKKAGHGVRFVGGCVRDAIADFEVNDIDLAIDATPELVLEALGAAKIRVVLTGIEHGTVTAIPTTRPFEITTLRRDVETDGRHATVEFTDDWMEDASRRDFTFNALSADPDGTVYDYFDGLEDLNAGRVRFIGSAAQRVAEDYLRILRFFRFQANYGKTEPDKESLEACQAAAGNVETVSGERIWSEISRTLTAPEPGAIFQMMEDIGLLGLLLPVSRSLTCIEALAKVESTLSVEPEPIRRLAALMRPSAGQTSEIATRLKLSRRDNLRLNNLNSIRGESSAAMNVHELRKILYAVGRDRFLDQILLDWSDDLAVNSQDLASSSEAWRETWDAAASWQLPEFPINGEDVLELGVEAGPRVREFLDCIQEWWVEHFFIPNRNACLDRLRQVIVPRQN